MRGEGLGGGMRLLLVLLTALLAAYLPAKFIVGWSSPDLASALGTPYLRSLPVATLTVVTITVALHSLLMIVVVRQVWDLAKVFQTGVFFSKKNVIGIRRIGILLLLISALGVVAPIVAILSVWLSGRPIQFDRIWAQIFNLPVGMLVCGLLSLILARAFSRALKMANEAKFTV